MQFMFQFFVIYMSHIILNILHILSVYRRLHSFDLITIVFFLLILTLETIRIISTFYHCITYSWIYNLNQVIYIKNIICYYLVISEHLFCQLFMYYKCTKNLFNKVLKFLSISYLFLHEDPLNSKIIFT